MPARVARIGVAVEFADGKQIMLFAEGGTAEAFLETVYESGGFPRTTLTVEGITEAAMHYGDPQRTAQALDSLHRSIEQD